MSDKDIKIALYLYKNKIAQKKIAALFNVDQSTISRIVTKTGHKHSAIGVKHG